MPGVPNERIGASGRHRAAGHQPSRGRGDRHEPLRTAGLSSDRVRVPATSVALLHSASLAPNRRRTFIALSFQVLAMEAPVCFHEGSNANTGEVHMKIHSTNRQMPKLCADAAADNRALLG
jgi:hypothetical protein